MFTFMRNFVGVKTDRAVQAGVEALVRWDPQGATEAELRSMEQHLDELGLQVAQARAAYDRERQEATTINALVKQRLRNRVLLPLRKYRIGMTMACERFGRP